jgi:hypothetical protein
VNSVPETVIVPVIAVRCALGLGLLRSTYDDSGHSASFSLKTIGSPIVLLMNFIVTAIRRGIGRLVNNVTE